MGRGTNGLFGRLCFGVHDRLLGVSVSEESEDPGLVKNGKGDFNDGHLG